ncbi:RSP_2647 family RNA methyltransferase [Nereida sp. MMG025]|uniref:RSP_2647 family RNA methyltransferase n=1 Tax=Nereida sp. MMG025 TaxID=2909981 RepID=UPI001F289670|nr:class I SAM-dependent rRNA methyltransferase [Nereida sp. MMG025]MCF6443561.1 class I SAM-dependent rRNA methyltransferase [Nereida sp. MMG025]
MTQPLSSSDLPVVRLKPKADARSIRFGAPWVYAADLVTDRRTKALDAGSLAVLEDTNRTPMGVVGVTPESQIIARMLDRDPTAKIDQAWFASRLQAALDHRTRLFAEPFYRLIHAEADGLPGVIIDRFGQTAVVQPNAAWADARLDALCAALVDVTGVECVIKSASGRARKLEGLDDVSAVVHGTAPDAPIPVQMNGATYLADVMGGQKTGLFYDQRPNHAFAASLSKGARVLDVFSHVGGFGLAALAHGATHVTCVDGAQPALDLAEAGAKTMGKGAAMSTRKGDAFDVLEALGAEGAQFDVVICDPPAFAPNKQALDRGLRAYERVAKLAAPLVADGGYLGLCSCSHAADIQKFARSNHRGIGRAGRRAQHVHTGFAGPDHPLMPQLSESGYLKAMFYRLVP